MMHEEARLGSRLLWLRLILSVIGKGSAENRQHMAAALAAAAAAWPDALKKKKIKILQNKLEIPKKEG